MRLWRLSTVSLLFLTQAVSLLSGPRPAVAGPGSNSALQLREQNHLLSNVERTSSELSRIRDRATGVEVALPLYILTGSSRTKHGTNWVASNGRLNVDTLAFGARPLSDLDATFRRYPGRRVIQRQLSSNLLILRGRDNDGSSFSIRVEREGGEARGLSIVYSNWAASELDSIADQIEASFVAFPRGSMTPPQVAQTNERQSATTDPAMEKRIKDLEAQLSEVRERERTQERIREEERKRADFDARLQLEREKVRAEEARKAAEEQHHIMMRMERLREQSAAGSKTDRLLLPATRRTAFVIGVNTYDVLNHLKTAVSDARMVAETLKSLGFEVVAGYDVTREQFYDRWYDFISKVEGGGVAAVFFAGHGINIDGKNFLLPSNSPDASVRPQVLMQQAVEFDLLRRDLANSKPRVSLFILDACRNNPYVSSLATRSISGRVGLAPVEATRGTFIMYSADLNEEALDRLPSDPPGELNSLYTRKLIGLLQNRELSLQTIAQRLRSDVRQVARTFGHNQTPAYYDGLIGVACLSDSCAEHSEHSAKK